MYLTEFEVDQNMEQRNQRLLHKAIEFEITIPTTIMYKINRLDFFVEYWVGVLAMWNIHVDNLDESGILERVRIRTIVCYKGSTSPCNQHRSIGSFFNDYLDLQTHQLCLRYGRRETLFYYIHDNAISSFRLLKINRPFQL